MRLIEFNGIVYQRKENKSYTRAIRPSCSRCDVVNHDAIFCPIVSQCIDMDNEKPAGNSGYFKEIKNGIQIIR